MPRKPKPSLSNTTHSDDACPYKRNREPRTQIKYVTSSHELVHASFSKFPRHETTLARLHDVLYGQQWHPIARIPKHVKDLGFYWPVLVPADRCWVAGEVPRIGEIVEFCERIASSKMLIEFEGRRAEDKKLADVLNQLETPPDKHPLVAHNVPIEGYGILDPNAIPIRKLRPNNRKDIDYSVNITPANKIVDIHIDQGTCGLSIGLGRSDGDIKLLVHKIWVLWPPTITNLQIYENLQSTVSTEGFCLLRSQQLEHGVIAAVGVESGIVLPPGWLHGTITSNGGFLGGITFHVSSAIGFVSTMLAIDLRLSPTKFVDMVPLYNDALRNLLQDSDDENVARAVKGWYEIEKSLIEIKFRVGSKHTVRECKKLLSAWRMCLSRMSAAPIQNHCHGCVWMRTNDDIFEQHFWSKHLSVVTPVGYKSPYASQRPVHGRKRRR